jgi:hypothetical protein
MRGNREKVATWVVSLRTGHTLVDRQKVVMSVLFDQAIHRELRQVDAAFKN